MGRRGTSTAGPPRARFRALGRRCAFAAIVIGAAVLGAWLVRPLLPFELAPLWLMKANTAACIVMLGIALAARIQPRPLTPPALAVTFAAVVTLAGLSTLAQYTLGVDLRIDRLIASDPGVPAPGRMAPLTAVSLILLGAAIIPLRAPRGPASWACDSALALTGAILQLVLSGYLFNQLALVGPTPLTRTSVQTLLALILLWLGAVLARADRGLFRVVGGAGPGSIATRALVPVTLLLPVVLAVLRSWGEGGLYTESLGIAMAAAAQSIILAASVMAFGAAINRSDAARRRAELRQDELERMIAVCAWTRRIRWLGEWVSIERFLSERFGLTITHGISEEALADLLASRQAGESTTPGHPHQPDE